jgi:aryl-alcohol dehydrogenase-like predicted oxidoreductase
MTLSPLPRQPFGATGVSVAQLGFGAGSVGDGAAQAQTLSVIETLLAAGGNLIDTAQIYGGSEEFIGRTLAHRRQDFVLVSKCGHHEILPDGRMRSLAISMRDIDQALQRTRCDHLDAMLLHSYDLDRLLQGDAIAVLAQAKAQGKIRAIGYSGDNANALAAAQIPEIDVLEMSLNLVDHYNIHHVLPVARARHLGVIAKRPLANAVWRMVNWPADQVSVHHVEYLRRWRVMTPALAGLLIRYPDPSALALRFTLSIPGVHVAIASTNNPASMQANIAAARLGPLPVADYNEILAAQQQATAAEGRAWPSLN